MPKIVINNNECEVEEGVTVIKACQNAGIEIPHFCFHERLKIAGNCRMCLVEIEKSPKLVASCATPVAEGMIIHTDTDKVIQAREGVMEFLLINHPLDCPICDQGGECDLQDQAFKYGRNKSRFIENKRSVVDKYMGPLIKTSMNRCIHCTRCIRFATDIAGVEEIGTIHRGEHMEIVTYLDRAITSELSGNMIDLCPVGALTAKPYAFKFRSWELKHTESIDVFDSMGCNIFIDTKGHEVMRIRPRINDSINEEWIADKSRFAYDGLKCQRLDRAYIKNNGKLVQSNLGDALELAAYKMSLLEGPQVAAIAGTMACCESMFLLKNIMQSLGSSNLECNQFGYNLDTTNRQSYLFNTTIAGLEDADVCLLIGANPRLMAPVLNARIGRLVRFGQLQVFRIGDPSDQTYKISDLGSNLQLIDDIISGLHSFSTVLQNAKRPVIIIGDGIYSRQDGLLILSMIHNLVFKYQIVRENWNGFNILHNHASMVGGLDIGFYQKNGSIHTIVSDVQNGVIKLVYLLGVDEMDVKLLSNAFVIYQGHHGDNGAQYADIILPGAAYTEKDATYVNFEGKIQHTNAAIKPPGDALSDWIMLSKLAFNLRLNLGFDINNVQSVREAMFKSMNSSDSKISQDSSTKITQQLVAEVGLQKRSIEVLPINYYMTDPISRASVTMAKCSDTIIVN